MKWRGRKGRCIEEEEVGEGRGGEESGGEEQIKGGARERVEGEREVGSGK